MGLDTAVILAAGMGVRLGDMSALRPKGFIDLGGGPIIERSVRLLLDAGVTRVVIVTGHLADFYRGLARRYPAIDLVHSPDYAATGSMYSLYLARQRPRSDFLLLESDLIYERRALELVCAAPGRDLLLCSGPTHSGDEVYVEAAAGRLTGLSKQRHELRGEVIGELAGITRLSPAGLAAMCAYAEARFAGTREIDYETALVVAAGSVPVECLLVADLLWAEIDDDRHLERAQGKVYPLLAARET